MTFKTNSSGFVTQQSWKGSGGTSVQKYTYNKKGQLTKSVGEYNTIVYKYDGKGRVKKLTETVKPDGSYAMTFKYDSKGYLTKELTNGKTTIKYANTYKGARLVKQVQTPTEYGSARTTTYTYKKLSVPKAAAPMVKAQQRYLLVGITAFAAAHK